LAQAILLSIANGLVKWLQAFQPSNITSASSLNAAASLERKKLFAGVKIFTELLTSKIIRGIPPSWDKCLRGEQFFETAVVGLKISTECKLLCLAGDTSMEGLALFHKVEMQASLTEESDYLLESYWRSFIRWKCKILLLRRVIICVQ